MVEEMIDVVVIGCGPAGLQAAIHAVRKKAGVVVLGRAERSSIFRAHVENYLCVPGVATGEELLRVGIEQATGFGAEILPEDALQIGQADGYFTVETESGRHLQTRTLIFATGTARKKLKVPGEKELAGRGVSYCVDCDANFFRNARVAVVGNESAAVDGALTLLKYAAEVHLVARELEVNPGLREKLAGSRVIMHEPNWVRVIQGEHAVTGVLLEDDAVLNVEGVFIELGAKGAMELATSLGVMLDPETFTHIDVNRKQETSVVGVYAAGDIAGQPYQMAKAVGEGCVAGWEAANYAHRQKREEAV